MSSAEHINSRRRWQGRVEFELKVLRDRLVRAFDLVVDLSSPEVLEAVGEARLCTGLRQLGT